MHTEAGQKRQKRKENRFGLELKSEDIVFDSKPGFRIDLSCVGGTNAQPDWVVNAFGFRWWIEYDEGQHKGYPVACDASRMLKIVDMLFVTGQDDPLYFLRVSTDSFTRNGKKVTNVKYGDIIRFVVRMIKTYKPKFKEGERYKVGYVGYDTRGPDLAHQWPVVCDDTEYPQEMQQHVECFTIVKP
jgi:hypothetical protein